jgi:hypothetical protein
MVASKSRSQKSLTIQHQKSYTNYTELYLQLANQYEGYCYTTSNSLSLLLPLCLLYSHWDEQLAIDIFEKNYDIQSPNLLIQHVQLNREK